MSVTKKTFNRSLKGSCGKMGKTGMTKNMGDENRGDENHTIGDVFYASDKLSC
jgi:hypothetical protein